MKMIQKNNNFYFLILNNFYFDSKNLNLRFYLKKNLLKFFYLKKNFNYFSNFLKVIHSIFIVNSKKLNGNEFLCLNKNNILFFLFNNKLYNINFLDILINNDIFCFDFKNYYISFFSINLLNIKKFIFILKLNIFLKKCQH